MSWRVKSKALLAYKAPIGSLTFSPTTDPSHTPRPQSHTSLLLFLDHARSPPASRSNALAISRPGMFFPQISTWLTLYIPLKWLKCYLLRGLLCYPGQNCNVPPNTHPYAPDVPSLPDSTHSFPRASLFLTYCMHYPGIVFIRLLSGLPC